MQFKCLPTKWFSANYNSCSPGLSLGVPTGMCPRGPRATLSVLGTMRWAHWLSSAPCPRDCLKNARQHHQPAWAPVPTQRCCLQRAQGTSCLVGQRGTCSTQKRGEGPSTILCHPGPEAALLHLFRNEASSLPCARCTQ